VNPTRRELAREYRETPRTSGVGVIRNTTNGKVLLVASTDLPSLLNRYQAELRLGGHRNAELQRDWNALGAEHFVFEVVDALPPPKTPDYDPTEDLETLQALWLEKLKPYAPAGYNPPPKAR
jgi:hypothetical protein